MPPTTAARCSTIVGCASLKRRAMAIRSNKLQSRLRGTKMFVQPRVFSPATTKEPRKPAPPVTITRCSCQKFMVFRPRRPVPNSVLSHVHLGDLAGQLVLECLEVGINHQLYQVLEPRLRFPPQN